jgi:hypothetical protein
MDSLIEQYKKLVETCKKAKESRDKLENEILASLRTVADQIGYVIISQADYAEMKDALLARLKRTNT